jgi:predicted dehydrogenase
MKLKIGIIGCGMITRVRHAPEFAATGNAEIAAFFDLAPERARELAARYGAESVGAYADILADPAIDAVSVCTTNATHAPIAAAALSGGKHVLCEKPMGVCAAEARAIAEVALASGKLLTPAFNQRLFPAHVKAKALLDGGVLGRVISFRSVFKHGGPETWGVTKGAGAWFFNKAAAGTGVLSDLAVHKIDLARHLLGENVAAVNALAPTLDKTGPDGKRIEIEDNAFILCQMESGICGSVEASWTNYGPEENVTVLYGEKGVMEIDPAAGVTVRARDGGETAYKTPAAATNGAQTRSGVIDAFVDAVLGKREPLADYRDGFASAAVIDACQRSAENGGREEAVEKY